MINKNNVVPIILFIISSVLFIIFALTIFFGGQKIGGAIYFIYFVIMLAFAFLDKKYSSSFIYFYRFSTYLSDAFNILAVASIIYYQIFLPYTISALAILSVAFMVDLFCKNRLEKRRLESILVSVYNCALMFAIFPYFFLEEFSLSFAIFIVVLSCLVLVNKIVLALVPYKSEKEVKDNKQDKQNELINEVVGDDNERNVE